MLSSQLKVLHGDFTSCPQVDVSLPPEDKNHPEVTNSSGHEMRLAAAKDI